MHRPATLPRWLKPWLAGFLLAGLLLPLLAGSGIRAASVAGSPTQPLPQSSEAVFHRAPFNQPDFYPLDRRPSADLYRPHAEWMGRLILPRAADMGTKADWSWIELEQTPPEHAELLGRRLRLQWAERPELESLVQAVSTDIHLAKAARDTAEASNVVPERLDGRRSVGPLESLAGARPYDDVTVRLNGVQLSADRLLISRPPVQISGRWSGLVQLLDEVDAEGLTTVRHFDRSLPGFNGPVERVRFPRQPPDRFGRRPFDANGLATSPFNREGWFVHGAPGPDGVFTVQSLEPRALTRLTPQCQLRSQRQALRYISHDNWGQPGLRPGALSTTQFCPQSRPSDWQIGDLGLVIHSFGGIGGRGGEPTPGWTVTGHFAFGRAEVVSDQLSGEPRLAITYHQIYANNPNGIVAGSQDWSAYMGNLQRGWLGLRPTSDAVVQLEGSLLGSLSLQSELISARYRSGDGGGVAVVTPSTSCVQDSNQALWIALSQLRRQFPGDAGEPRLQWLAEALDELLTPMGMVRADWRHNAEVSQKALLGVDLQTAGTSSSISSSPFSSSQKVRDALLSWRSMLPRRGHDDVAKLFIQADLPVRFLRTNGDWRHLGQMQGSEVALLPLAPTTLLGQLPLAGRLTRRISDALFPPPIGRGLGFTALVLGVYASVAIPLGRRSGLLKDPWRWPSPGRWIQQAVLLFLSPALIEELLFRVALLPHPLEGTPPLAMLGWGALSVGAFVLYHPLASRFWYPQGRRLFHDPRFLAQTALLGTACVVVYVITGSLWSAVVIHWLSVLTWLEPLQGRRWLESRHGTL